MSVEFLDAIAIVLFMICAVSFVFLTYALCQMTSAAVSVKRMIRDLNRKEALLETEGYSKTYDSYPDNEEEFHVTGFVNKRTGHKISYYDVHLMSVKELKNVIDAAKNMEGESVGSFMRSVCL